MVLSQIFKSFKSTFVSELQLKKSEIELQLNFPNPKTKYQETLKNNKTQNKTNKTLFILVEKFANFFECILIII